MVVDCHFHIDEKMLSMEQMIAEMDKKGIDKAVLISPINDSLFDSKKLSARIPKQLYPYMLLYSSATAEKLYSSFVQDGVFCVPGNRIPIVNNPDNSIVAQKIAQYPERFLGWISVNPLLPDVLQEIEKYIDQPGFIGVKVHPFFHQYSISELDSIAEFCQKAGKPILIHLSAEPDCYKYLPDKFSDLKVIYAHAGLPFCTKVWEYAKDKPNVYVDLSGEFINAKVVKKAVAALGSKRCLFGSDGPYGECEYNTFDYSGKKGWVETLNIPQSEKEAILGNNLMEMIK